MTIKINDLTASQAVYTDASKNLVTDASLATSRPAKYLSEYASLTAALLAVGTDTLIIDVDGTKANTDTIAARLQFVNDAKITSAFAYTITHLDGDPLHQIFDGAGVVSFAAGAVAHVRPEWFGAIGGGVDQCNADAIMAAGLAAKHSQLIFTNGNYVVKKAVTIPMETNVSLGIFCQNKSKLFYVGTEDIIVLTVGTAGNLTYQQRMELAVERETVSDWDSENSIGIRVYSPYECNITIRESLYNTIGCQLLASGTGAFYNEFHLGILAGNKYGLDLNTDGGFINENLFLGGRFTCFNSINPQEGKSRYGIRITSNNSYYNNSNLFIKPSFEINLEKAQVGNPAGEAIPVLMEYGLLNTIENARTEINSLIFARESNNSSNNKYTTQFGGTIDVIENASTIDDYVFEPGSLRPIQASVPVWSSGALHKIAYKNEALCYVPGVCLIHFGGAAVEAGIAIIEDDYLEFTDAANAPDGVGVFVNTATTKRFVVRREVMAGHGGRINIRCFDAAGAELDDEDADHPYVKGQSGAPFFWSGSSKAYSTGSDSSLAIMFVVGAAVDSIIVAVMRGTATLQIKSFGISTIDPGQTVDPYVNYGATEGAQSSPQKYFNGEFTAPAIDGWYRVAKFTGSNGRGYAEIEINTIGGASVPKRLNIKVFNDYSVGATIEAITTSLASWTDVRVTADVEGAKYVEVNLIVAGLVTVTRIECKDYGYNRLIEPYQTPVDTVFGDTVLKTLPLKIGNNYTARTTITDTTEATTTTDGSLQADGGLSVAKAAVIGGNIVGPKAMMTADGGLAVLLTNKTGGASVKGEVVRANSGQDNSVVKIVVDVPDPIGVFYESGIADGAEAWVVVSGIADVYFVGNATRGHLARGFLTADGASYVTGQALSEAFPTSPFSDDKHFYEIGHVLASRTGAGITKCVLHFN